MITFTDVYEPIEDETLSRIPDRMKAHARWVIWGGNKTPVNGNRKNRNGFFTGADITNPETWLSFSAAVRLIGQACYVDRTKEYFHIVGIGFVVGDGWFCLDMDGGEKHRKEDVPEAAIDTALAELKTYAETSISGCGYHVFGFSEDLKIEKDQPESFQPNGREDSYEIELFARRKFIVITGNRVKNSEPDVNNCGMAAMDYYHSHILEPWEEAREKRMANMSKRTIPTDADAATQLFLNAYNDILRYSDSGNFKRNQWIGLVKAMRDTGIPQFDVLEWCKRGSNFKSEDDVFHVWNETRGAKDKPATVAAIVEDAKRAGWKPTPDQLTGEYKEKHDTAEAYKARQQKIAEGMRTHLNQKSTSETVDPVTGEITVSENSETDIAVHQAVEIQKPTPAAQQEMTPEEVAKALIQNLSEVKTQGKRYIFKPYLPIGKFSILNADPGVGKTKVASAIAALVTTGSPLLGIRCERPGKVLLFSIEDDAEDFLHTVSACGGDTSKVMVIRDDDDSLKLLKKHKLTYDSPVVEEMIKQVQPSLVVFDPYQKYLPKGVDMNRANELSDALSSVVRLAKQYDCHIMIIGHNTKAQTGLTYRFMGSQDFLGEARSGLSVVRDPERVKEQENLILHVKSNNRTGKAIRYKIESIPGNEDYARIAWLGLEDYTEMDYAKSQRRKLKEAEGEPSPLTITNPVVRTVMVLLKENPDGIAIGYDDFISAKDAITGSVMNIRIETEIHKISAWLNSEYGIGVACRNATKLKPYYLKGELQIPTKNKDRHVLIQRNRNVDIQQQAFEEVARIK